MNVILKHGIHQDSNVDGPLDRFVDHFWYTPADPADQGLILMVGVSFNRSNLKKQILKAGHTIVVEQYAIDAIVFPKCGAEKHPAFSSAYQLSGGDYRLDFDAPTMRARGISISESARKEYFIDKARHLRSWGVRFNQVTFLFNTKEA